MLTGFKCLAILVWVVGVGSGAFAQRSYGGMYTQQRLANIRNNAQTVSFVITQKNAAVTNAAPWLAMSDEQLWSMIPAQSLPRCIDVTWDYDFPNQQQLGCLNCGDGIKSYGNYPYNPDFKNKPWKLTCPNCGVVFPTNDFGAYYQSGINSKGEFDPAVANQSLLYNTAYPNPSHALHKYGVDNGYGYVDSNGRQHKFIAYYAWKYWRYIQSGLSALANAYMYTGDAQYARKAGIMLDRIADLYPAMDWAPYANMGWFHSDGGSKMGKIEGRIWETSQFQVMVEAYDKIISGTVNNTQLYTFLQLKDQQFTLPGTKGTRAALISNIDSGLLETGALAVQAKRIWGNEGMHQSAMAYAAVALNTEPKTSQFLDWIFAPGSNNGHLPTMLVQLFDRDGMANEGSPAYNYLWPGQLTEILSVTEPYTAYTRNRVTRDYPWFRNAFTAPWRVQALNTFMPNIGDTGATGLISPGITAAQMAPGFQYFGDPASARFAWEANGSKADNLLIDIGSTTPYVMNQALAQAAQSYPQETRLGEHMAAYGLATVEFGSNSAGKALWCYYGRNTGHGNLDRLNFSIYAFNTDLTPDLGYPEFASSWPHRTAWTNNTISHNTVVVNKSPQSGNWTGYPQFFTVSPGFGAFEIESKNVYSATSEYMRTMAFIQLPDSNAYAVDVFRVTGGTDHLMSFHGPPGTVQVSGGSFVNQATGTYAGANVAYGDNSTAYPLGYSYLKNVSKALNPPSSLWLDWKAQSGYRGVTSSDNLHLRLHVVTPLDDLALADGVPPQNKAGNPASIRYALMHRQAAVGQTSLQSQFVSVAEPWKNSNFVNSVTRMNLTEAATDVVALKIDLKNSITDYVISNPARRSVTVVNGPTTDGQFAWVRTESGVVTSASLTRGTQLSMSGVNVQGVGEVTGQLVRFERDPTKPPCAWVTMNSGTAASMVGSQIYFSNDRSQTACYDVFAAEPDAGGQWKLTCGPGVFVRGYVNANDYSQGFTYNIADGASFYSPITTVRTGPGPSSVGDSFLY